MDELSRINDWSTVAREVARRGTGVVPPQSSEPRQLPSQPSQLTAAVASELERSPAAVVSIRVELMGHPADRAAEQRRAQQQASERAAGETSGQRAALTRRAQPQPAFRTAQAPRVVIVDQPTAVEGATSSATLPQLSAYAGPDAHGSASSQPTAAERFASFGGERAVSAYAQQRSWQQEPQRQLLDLRA